MSCWGPEVFIAYHGTRTKQTADLILSVGFRKGSYFAFDISDAVAYGGDYIFAVDFSGGTWKGEPDGWQFRSRDWIDTRRIRWYGRIHRRIRTAPIVNPLAKEAGRSARRSIPTGMVGA